MDGSCPSTKYGVVPIFCYALLNDVPAAVSGSAQPGPLAPSPILAMPNVIAKPTELQLELLLLYFFVLVSSTTRQETTSRGMFDIAEGQENIIKTKRRLGTSERADELDSRLKRLDIHSTCWRDSNSDASAL